MRDRYVIWFCYKDKRVEFARTKTLIGAWWCEFLNAHATLGLAYFERERLAHHP